MYFMDPTTGIAVVFGAQVSPSPDIEVYKMAIKLEHTLYKGLNVGVHKLWNMEVIQICKLMYINGKLVLKLLLGLMRWVFRRRTGASHWKSEVAAWLSNSTGSR